MEHEVLLFVLQRKNLHFLNDGWQRTLIVLNYVNRHARWPVVRFAESDQEYTILPQQFSYQLGDRILAQRQQLPLELAWALSIHKAQGSTVNQAIVDVRHAFEVGQVYGKSDCHSNTVLMPSFLIFVCFDVTVCVVALSRVKSLTGLSLVHAIRPSQVKVDHTVVAFYEKLLHDERHRSQERAVVVQSKVINLR